MAYERGMSTPPKKQYILKNRLTSKAIKVLLELGGDLYGVKTYVKSKILTSRWQFFLLCLGEAKVELELWVLLISKIWKSKIFKTSLLISGFILLYFLRFVPIIIFSNAFSYLYCSTEIRNNIGTQNMFVTLFKVGLTLADFHLLIPPQAKNFKIF